MLGESVWQPSRSVPANEGAEKLLEKVWHECFCPTMHETPLTSSRGSTILLDRYECLGFHPNDPVAGREMEYRYFRYGFVPLRLTQLIRAGQ